MKNKIILFAGKWMELEIIMLSTISQTKRQHCMFSFVCQKVDKRKKMNIIGALFWVN
jgi:hypothetical protein